MTHTSEDHPTWALAAHGDIPAALEDYGRQRVAFGRFIVGHARALGAYMQAQLLAWQEKLSAISLTLLAAERN